MYQMADAMALPRMRFAMTDAEGDARLRAPACVAHRLYDARFVAARKAPHASTASQLGDRRIALARPRSGQRTAGAQRSAQKSCLSARRGA